MGKWTTIGSHASSEIGGDTTVNIQTGDYLVMDQDGIAPTWKRISIPDSINIDLGHINPHTYKLSTEDKKYTILSLMFGIILNTDSISELEANYVIEKEQFKADSILTSIKRNPGAAAMNMAKLSKNKYIKQKLIELKDQLPKNFIEDVKLNIELSELGF